MAKRLLNWGLIALAVAFVIFWFWMSGREGRLGAEGREKVIKLLDLAGKGQYSEIESSGLASREVVEFLRERDEKWGKVKSATYDSPRVDSIQAGSSWNVMAYVTRERKAVRELYVGRDGMVRHGNVPWPAAEE